MAEEIKKVISIDTKGADSVKDLIDKVEKLRGVLKNLDKTSDEYKSALSELKTAQDSLTSSLGENKTQAEAAEGSYNALSQQMRVLKKEWKATSDEAERDALGKEIKDINDQLKALDRSIGNNQRNVGNYAGSFQGLKEEIRQARDIMAGAARGSEEYAAAAQRAAEASDKLRDMQKEISMGASGLDNKFAVTSSLLGSISGGFAAAQGAMALFGVESENLQKTFVKLQAAMSITQGFKALAELPKGLNAAKVAFGGVTTGVKNFTKSLTLVKGAIAATGIGVLLVLLGELIAHWDEVTAAVSNFVGGLDGLKETMNGVGNSIKEFVMGPVKALDLALHKDFKGAWDAFKNGWKVSANYAQGVQNQMVRNTQNAEKKKREEFDKTTDDYIKDMEAQKGADWKYTKEGQKTYREYYENRLKMAKEGTEDYKKAQRDLWSYELSLKTHSQTSGSGNSDAEAKAEEKALEERKKRAEELYEELTETETSAEEKLHKNNLNELKQYREEMLYTDNEYQSALIRENERHNKVMGEIANKGALELVNQLKNKFERELDKFRGELIGNMFPTDEEVDLAIKQLDVEDGPFAKYLLNGKAKWQIKIGDLIDVTAWDKDEGYGIVNYLTDVEKKIQDLQKMTYEFSMADLLLGEGSGAKGKGAMEFFDLIDSVNEAVWYLENDRMPDFWEKMDEITSQGVKNQQELVRISLDEPMGWLSSFFSWRYQKGSEVVEAQIESNNRELAAFLAVREKELEAIQEQLAVESLLPEERIRLAQEAEAIKREEIEKTAEIERRNSEITLDVVRQVEDGKKRLIQSTLESISNTGDFLMNWSDNIVKKETKNNKKISDDKERQARTMFNVGKALAISEAVVSTYQGAQESYTALASIPYVGPALGIAAAAAAVTAGILRIQQISSQEFGNKGNLSDAGSSVGTTSAVAVPQLESTPYQYTSNVTNAADEAELNRPIIVQVSDVEDAMKVRESRSVETSF